MLKVCKIVVFFLIVTIVSSASFPSMFGRCKATDFKCIQEKMEDALNKLADGNKELGIPPIDPFLMEKVTVPKRPGAISLSQTYTNLKVYGLSDTNVIDFSMDLNNCGIYLEMMMPYNRATAHYAFEGQLLTIPLNTEADFEVIHHNLKSASNITCEKYQKDGMDFLRFLEVHSSFQWGDLEFHMGEMFQGNPTLNEQIEKSINDDPVVLVETFRPEFGRTWEAVIKEGANNFFSQIPLKEVFIDYE